MPDDVPARPVRDAVLVPAGHPDAPAWRDHGAADVLELHAAGPRWPVLADALERLALAPGGAVWLPARDVRAEPQRVALLLALHRELGVGLSQPALTPDSPASTAVELVHRGLAVRLVDVVGLSAPVLSAEVVRDCLPALRACPEGAGLPELLHAVLERRGLRSAVLDCLPVRRTAPTTAPVLVDGCHPGAAAMGLAVRLGVPVPRPPVTRAALDDGFRPLGRRAALERVLAGWPEPEHPLPPQDPARAVVVADLAAAGEDEGPVAPW